MGDLLDALTDSPSVHALQRKCFEDERFESTLQQIGGFATSAWQLQEQRGSVDGFALDDWLQTEAGGIASAEATEARISQGYQVADDSG